MRSADTTSTSTSTPTRPRARWATAVAATAAAALALTGCAAASPADDGTVQVVASTNVYAQIAEAIGGDLITATAVITSETQDPHSYEASARDQLLVSRADLIIENGGGYDAFMDQLIEASGTAAAVLTAVEFSVAWPGDDHDHSHEAEDHSHEAEDHSHEDHAHEDHDHAAHDHAAHDHADHQHVEGFNEHVWYDPATMDALAVGIATELEVLDPDGAETFAANLETFRAGIAELGTELGAVAAAHAGAPIFVTEPLPLYLTDAAGLRNVTPEAFSQAVEEGRDVAPAVMLEALRLVPDVDLVITNAQTGGAETTQIVREAETDGIPVVAFTELLPAGQTYLTWMQANIDALTEALAQ